MGCSTDPYVFVCFLVVADVLGCTAMPRILSISPNSWPARVRQTDEKFIVLRGENFVGCEMVTVAFDEFQMRAPLLTVCDDGCSLICTVPSAHRTGTVDVSVWVGPRKSEPMKLEYVSPLQYCTFFVPCNSHTTH